MKTDMYKVYLFWQAVTIWHYYYYSKYNFSTYIGKFVTARARAREEVRRKWLSVSARRGGAGPGSALAQGRKLSSAQSHWLLPHLH